MDYFLLMVFLEPIGSIQTVSEIFNGELDAVNT